jgi:site-specific DNA-methyltransferase (adenine-specific)
MAAKQLGMTEVPCIRLDDLTDEQRRAYGLAHNKTAELSTWDAELLPLEVQDLPTYDMEQFGFSAEQTKKPEPEPVVQEDDFDEDADEIEARTQLGDLILLGGGRPVLR